jgi:hypothetical protein
MKNGFSFGLGTWRIFLDHVYRLGRITEAVGTVPVDKSEYKSNGL